MSEIPFNAEAAAKIGTIKVNETKTGLIHVFFHAGGNSSYIFKDGKVGLFKTGLIPALPSEAALVTDIQGQIDALNEEIAIRHYSIYTKEDFETITREMLEPNADVKAKAVEEFKDSGSYNEAVESEVQKRLLELGVDPALIKRTENVNYDPGKLAPATAAQMATETNTIQQNIKDKLAGLIKK